MIVIKLNNNENYWENMLSKRLKQLRIFLERVYVCVSEEKKEIKQRKKAKTTSHNDGKL